MHHRDASHISPVPFIALNLDLAELSGGGASPSRFTGKTHGGQILRCTYDDGYLRITRPRDTSREAIKNAKVLSAGRIGPKVHGFLTLAQLCHVAGLTVNGAYPRADLPGQQDYLDFSGQTTYYSLRLNSSAETYHSFVDYSAKTRWSLIFLAFLKPTEVSDPIWTLLDQEKLPGP